MASREESGFTLVEILVALSIFAFVSVGFYMSVFSTQRGADLTRDVADNAAEARLGFSRMVRDTREARSIRATGPNSFEIDVDFDYNGVVAQPPAVNSQGDYEQLVYTYTPASGTITLSPRGQAGEVLMRGVDCVLTGATCADVFTYTSNRLEYDWNRDGVTTCLELDQAVNQGVVGVGNGNNQCDSGEWNTISNVAFALQVESGDSSESFRAEAQMRNQR